MTQLFVGGQAIGLSILAGVLWAVLGWWKARQKGEEFSGPKFTRAIVIGIIVGAISGWRGLSFETSEVVLMQVIGAFGATGLIDWVAIEIWKRVSKAGRAETIPAKAEKIGVSEGPKQ